MLQSRFSRVLCLTLILFNLFSISYMSFYLSSIHVKCEENSRMIRIILSFPQVLVCMFLYQAIYPEFLRHINIFSRNDELPY